MNNRLFLLFIFMISFCSGISADEAGNLIRMHQVPKGGTHYNLPQAADEPDVYYDIDNQVIIIDGTGYVTYYDVVIESATSWTVMISTQVSGSYDTIDISSLPQGMYCITIDSPTGNSYEGFFDTY